MLLTTPCTGHVYALQLKALMTCMGCIAYSHLRAAQFRHAVVCFALQSMLYMQAVCDGCAPSRHASLFSMSCADIWQCFSVVRTPCVYAIVSLSHKHEYIGSTVNWRNRCYQHSRHVCFAGLSGEQAMHTFVRRFANDYVFVPISVHGGSWLETRLIKTYSPALNVQHVPGCYRVQAHATSKKPGAIRRRRHSVHAAVVCKYSTHGKVFLQLFDALCHLASTHGGVVNISQGSQWLDNSKVLLRAFGSCLVSCVPLGVTDTPLAKVWQALKQLSSCRPLCVCFTGVLQVHPFLLARPVLLQLLANRSTVRDLYHYTESQIIGLMRAAMHFTPVKSRLELSSLINSVYRCRFGRSLSVHLVVRVPPVMHTCMPAITTCVKDLLGVLPVSPALVAWHLARLRVVGTSGKCIARLLHNHRCVATSATLRDLQDAVDAKWCVKCSEFADHPVLNALNLHTGISPVGSIHGAMCSLMAQFAELCCRFTGHVTPEAAELLRVLRSQLLDAVYGAKVQHHLSQLAAIPRVQFWYQFRAAIDSCGLVCLPLDRDPRSSAIMTKGSYLCRLRRLFLEDVVHYEPSVDQPSKLLHLWHECYIARRWKCFGRFDLKGNIGYAYCFPKAKNVSRDRVIVSCVNHPIRTILHRVGCILIQLLCKCAFVHFNLHSVAEFTHKWERYARSVGNSDALLSIYTDVKEMYTGMKHGPALDAVGFVISRCKAALRSPYVSCSTGNTVVFGKCRAAGFVTFHLDDLLQFVQFELENLFFTVGSEVVLRQKVGAAMGGFTSPGCAQCVAAVAEYQCMSWFIASSCLFATRYMDDTFVILNLTAINRLTVSLAVVLHYLFHMYDTAGLEVELESLGFHGHVLQSTMSVINGVHCSFWNKNEAFMLTGQQKVRRLLPAFLQSKQRQRAVLTGLFHRMQAATFQSCVSALLPVLLQLRYEVMSLGYPSSMFAKCLHAFAYSRLPSQRSAWVSLWHRFLQFQPP